MELSDSHVVFDSRVGCKISFEKEEQYGQIGT
jgi:hypothetical protein